MDEKTQEAPRDQMSAQERRRLLTLGSIGALAAIGAVTASRPAEAQSCTLPCYPPQPAESGVTVVNSAYPPGDLRRYGADTTGVADSTAAIVAACSCKGGGTGRVLHPGGTITHNSTIIVPDGVSISGGDRANCVFNYTGSGSAWRFTKGPNSSGYAMVNFSGIRVTTSNAANSGAAIELNAGGWSYFEIHDCWLSGKFQYGLILDAVEICSVYDNIIDTVGTPNPIQLWLVNGPERTPGQGTGFTNVVSIRDNQLSGSGGYGLIDDGGNSHKVIGNNFNGHSFQAKFAGVTSLILTGNSFESALQTGTFNIAFTTLGVLGGTKGTCTNAVITGNTFAGNMSSGDCIVTAAAKHTAFHISANYFESLYGRHAAIDVTYLGNSFVGFNYDAGNASMAHYRGAVSGADGNTLLPPQNGAIPPSNIDGPMYADTRFPHLFYGGVGLGSTAAPAALPDIARLFVDSADGDLKVRFKNGTVKTIATD